MKTIINKLRYTLLVCLLAIVATAPMHALTLDVCNTNTTTNEYVPVYGLFYDDNYQITQMIYPESLLTSMRDGTINSLTFYANSNITLTGGSFTIRLGITNSSSFGSATRITTGMTAVATSNMTTCRNGSQINIAFTTPYNYTGGNLVVEFQSTTTGSSYQSLSFQGVDSYSNSSIYGRNSSSTPSSFTRQSFLPRATFNYTSSTPTISANPTALNFNSIPGATATQTVTITGFNLTGNITTALTDANGVFSVSPASLGTSGGTLTVTYSPTAVGIHNATLTLSSAGADPVTITLNGTSEYAKTIFEDGTDTNGNLPIYGNYSEQYQINQMIYPQSELTDLIGSELTSMTFYTTEPIDANHAGHYWTVRLGTTDQTTFGSTGSSTPRLVPSDVVAVVTDFEVTTGVTQLTITFDQPFPYNGGNLLVDFQQGTHPNSYKTINFYGKNQNEYTGYYSRNANATPTENGHYTNYTAQMFLPKVKFTYELSEPITQGTVSPSAVSFGEVQVGQSATQTVTVRNTGNQPFTPVIDATSLPAGVSVSTASQIAAGGNLPLTVTFAPTAEGAVSGSFTVTIPVPDEQGDDIVVTVNVTGSGYEISSTLTSQTVVVPVYKSDIQAPSRTYVFSREEVENDTLRTLSYSDGAKIQTQVLVKAEEPVVSYDLHRKAGSGNWTYPGGNAVAQAVQQSSPSTYVVGQETFTIPQDATQLWVPMTDEGVDASSELLYVPVTVADGVVTTGNTYGAPQVAATSDGLTITFEVTGSKSAGGVGGNWDQTLPDGTTENYCVYSPVITITSVDPAFGINTRLPYMFRAWLLVDNSDIYYYDIKRVPNTNDPTHGHIVADSLITQPKLLGTLPGTPDMVGIGPFGPIGYEWTEGGELSPSGNVKPESVFGAPTDLGNREMKFAVRVYYYKPQAETPSGHMLRAAGDDTPEDGYAYADQDESDSQDIQTAVNSIYGDREVVDVQYVNALGQQSSKPFEGVNIVVTRYSDGTMSTTKVLK